MKYLSREEYIEEIKYCYENSPEFKEYVDNANEKMTHSIKTMHKYYYGSHVQEYLLHFATMGLTLLFKKLREKKEFAKLKKTIQSDEFKTLFSNFDTVLLNNKIRNSTK